jgi:Predicted membrane protein (DUF2232)
MSKAHVMAMAGGALGAALYMSFWVRMPGEMMIIYFAPLPFFAVGLSLGVNAALIAGAVGAAVIAVTAALPVLWLFLFTLALPVAVLVRWGLLSRTRADGKEQWYPVGHLIAWITAMALAGLAAAMLYFAGEPGGFVGAAERFLEARLFRATTPQAQAQLGPVIPVFARFLGAMLVITWMMMITVNATVTQWILHRHGHAVRPTPRYSALALPPWMIIALAAAAALSLVPGQIGVFGQNAVLIAALPFFLLGLAVIHVLSRSWQGRRMALVAVYLAIIMIGWPALIIAGLGVAEQWLGLRQRFAGSGPDEEEE